MQDKIIYLFKYFSFVCIVNSIISITSEKLNYWFVPFYKKDQNYGIKMNCDFFKLKLI